MAEITRKRIGELVKGLFAILLQAPPEGLRAGEALERLAASIDLTPYEQGVYASSGVKRFDKIVRFATIDCAKAGWLVKHKGIWLLTDAGRKAMTDYPDPEVFYRQAVKLYQAWSATKQGQTEVQADTPEAVETTATQPGGPPGTGKSADVTFEAAEEQAWGEIEQYLRSMPPYDFQDLVADLLKSMGYHVLWVAPPGKDGGLDIIASSDPLGTKPPHIKVQVKRTSARADTDTVKSFVAVLDGEDVGIFVAAGGFTKDADEFARHQAKRHVTLIDLDRLFDLWVEFYPRLSDSARRRLPLTPIYFLTSKE
jgi:restriction system protein